MSIVSDSVHLATDEPGLVRLEYGSVMKTAVGRVDERRIVWLESSSAAQLAASLRSFLGVEQLPPLSLQNADDHITIYSSGPDQAPYVNIRNERIAGSAHDGSRWFAMSTGLAWELVAELDALLARRDRR